MRMLIICWPVPIVMTYTTSVTSSSHLAQYRGMKWPVTLSSCLHIWNLMTCLTLSVKHWQGECDQNVLCACQSPAV
jgi:hypothetical protein